MKNQPLFVYVLWWAPRLLVLLVLLTTVWYTAAEGGRMISQEFGVALNPNAGWWAAAIVGVPVFGWLVWVFAKELKK